MGLRAKENYSFFSPTARFVSLLYNVVSERM